MEVKRYPIRGALYGLLLGLSAAYFIFFRFTMFGFDSLGSVITKLVIIVLIGIVIGVVWAYVAPARGPKGPAPAASFDDSPPPAFDEAPAAEFEDSPPAAFEEQAPMEDEPPAGIEVVDAEDEEEDPFG